MPITQKFTIVCDEVRQENNGKFIIIGMYTPDLAVAQIPIVMPSLTFLAWLESDRPGDFSFKIRLDHLESGKTLAQGMGMVRFQRPGVGISAVRLGGIQFSSPGAYTFNMQFDGQQEFLTQFSVILNVPPQQGLQQQVS